MPESLTNNNSRNNYRPLHEEYLIKQVEGIREEILYKMKLVHRVGLAVVSVPIVVLPIFAKLQDYIPNLLNDTNNVNPSTFDTILILVSYGVPILLLWTEIFCITQTNGILRAGEWLCHIEQQLNIASSSSTIYGWESWLNTENRRRSDDIFTRYVRFVLISLFYFTAVTLAALLTHNYAIKYWFSSSKSYSQLYFMIPIILFTAIYIGFLFLRKHSWYKCK